MLRSCPSVALVEGVKIGSSQPAGQLQPGRHGRAVHGARPLVLLVGLPGQVAAHDALEVEHLGPAHQDGPAGPLRRQRERRPTAVSMSAGSTARMVPGTTSAISSHQKHGHGREHPALVRDGLGHDHVERADPVRGDHEQAVRRRRRRARGPCPSGPGAARSSRRRSQREPARRRSGRRGAACGSRSNASSSWAGVERDLGVGLEDGAEGAALGPGRAGVALDDPVGLVAGQAGRDQRQEDGLGEDEAERALGQVLRAPARGGSPGRRPARSPCAACSRPAGTRRAGPPARPSCARCRARATAPRPRARHRGSRAAAGPGRRAARRGWGCACAAWPSCPSGRRRRAPPPRRPRCGPGGGSRCT